MPARAFMAGFAIRRVIQLLITIAATSTTIFVLIHLSGDPTDGFLAPGSSDQVRNAVRERLGLDQPLAEQYVRFLGNALTGDFGSSWRDRQPALRAVLDRLPATLLLGTAAATIAIIGGTVLGIVAAMWRPGVLRSLVRVLAISGQAIPAFWLGTIGIVLFAVRLRWLPSSGNEGLLSLVLPAFTLAAHPGSMIARLLQSALLDARSSSYVAVAHGKGLPRRYVCLRHMLPNAIIPSLAYIGLQASLLVGGAIVIESVFAYPGVGRLALQATMDRDVPVMHAFVIVTVVLVSAINLTVDLIAVVLDPRQRSRSPLSMSYG
ncbi:MAG: ABC transporter permease [Chloroflexota bacterium]|nr:ABC transporter permease [Chloroflexota bacterium]